MRSRLHNILIELDRISEVQFGLRAGLCAEYQTIRLSETIRDGFSNTQTPVTVFLDFLTLLTQFGMTD